MQINSRKPIGILGGTFDPIHHGHLRIAVELYQRLDWQEVRFVPCKTPVLAKINIATEQQRLQMLQLAIKDQPGLMIDERELIRTIPSYTIETLIPLHEEFPATPLCLIIGYDALLNLDQWHRWQELLMYAHLIVILRPNYELPKQGVVAELIKKHLTLDAKSLTEKMAGSLFFPHLQPLAISSTDIREQISLKYSPRYLLPEAVIKFIQHNKIYCSNA